MVNMYWLLADGDQSMYQAQVLHVHDQLQLTTLR